MLINAPLKLCLGATKVYWVENYFKYGEQAVKTGNMFSSIKLIATGNPSGIHLEPLLLYFLSSLNDLAKVCRTANAQVIADSWHRGNPQVSTVVLSTCPVSAEQGSLATRE